MESRHQAKWIWLSGFQDFDEIVPGRFVLFRKNVEVTEKPRTPCFIHASADTRYRLFVNGQSVAFGPCKSYPSRWYYEKVDISPHLHVGSNVITAKVLRFFPNQIGSTSLMRTYAPGFIMWGEINGAPIVTDETWLCCQDDSVQLKPRSQWNYILGPPFLSLDEKVDFSLAQTNWQSDDVDFSQWSNAIPAIASVKMMPVLEPWKLYPRPIPLLPENEKNFTQALKASESTPLAVWISMLNGHSTLQIEAGQRLFVELEAETLTTGFLEFEFVGGAGAEVAILYAESYEKDLGTGHAPFPMKRHKADRREWRNGRLYGTEDHITLAGKDTERSRYEPFWFRTFRFVRLQISTRSTPLTVTRIAYRETYYPLDITTKIDLSPELKPIWQICINTLQKCMHETYEDCPFYEQNQFAMDGRLQLLFTYQLSNDDRLARKTIHEFYASRREDGLLETNFPVSFNAINIPQFSLFWILMLHDHMTYFADKSLVQKYIGTADGILQYFDSRINEDGLVGAFDSDCWAFVDWVREWQGTKGIRDMAVPPIYKKTGVAAYNSLVYAWVLEHAAQLCVFINRHDTAVEYRERAAVLNQNVRIHCYLGNTSQSASSANDHNQVYFTDGPGTTDISQHTQIFAILSGAITGASAMDLMERVMTNASVPKCSYAMQHYVFRALEKTGLYDKYFGQMIQPWKQMVADNLTTCAEDDVAFRSDCHGWSASPIYEFVAVINGIRPRKETQVEGDH